MAVNKPVGDNARKGAVKKRAQRKTAVMGKPAWTKCEDIRRVNGSEKEHEEVQGRQAREVINLLAADDADSAQADAGRRADATSPSRISDSAALLQGCGQAPPADAGGWRGPRCLWSYSGSI
jgi:hypothetical protein